MIYVERTFVAAWSEPSQVAVALFAWQCSPTNVHTFPLKTAILICRALVPELASSAVIVFITFAFCGKVFSMARACLSVFSTGLYVNISTRPKSIRVCPLVRLTQQSQSTVLAREILWQVNLVRLSSATNETISQK